MVIKKEYDVMIMGTGPAGLQAAVHAARKKVSVLLLGRPSKSSLFHAHVENFCCLFKVSGEEMLKVGKEQAVRFGTEVIEEDVLSIQKKDERFQIKTESGFDIEGKALIVATGATRNKLKIPGEDKYLGRGVSYCVECDGNFFKGEEVCVVGNESAAVGGVLTLMHLAGRVHLVCKTLEVSDALKTALFNSGAVIHQGVWAKELVGDGQLKGLVLSDGSILEVSGVFIELGARGVMELATSLGLQLDDEMKYIETNKSQETNVPGIFAAGDICGPPWQMAKAVGEGCVAGISAATYVRKIV